jgi:hypothetical protein
MPCQAASHAQQNGLNCKESVIDIPADLGPAEWPKECCIYRVPKKLRKVNKDAYTPKLISIGPFHHRQEYQDMEVQKKKYLRDFCKRTKKSQEDLASIVKAKVEQIRDCYAETSKFNRTIEFLKLILLDGIFIIELFWRNSKKEEREKDYILSKPWLSDGIQHDLLLLENQLPYFVLEDLYVSGAEGQEEDDRKKERKDEFLKLCREYFSKYDRHPDFDIFEGKKIIHLTDLLRCFFYPPGPPPPKEEEVKKGKKKAIDRLCCAKAVEKKEKKTIDRLCSATKLDETGVKFKKVKGKPLLDIKFQKGNFKSSIASKCLS